VDYESAVKNYIALRAENKRITDEAEAKVAENKATMEKLGVWIQLKAEQDKLDKVNTTFGTVFWTNTARCSVSNADEFFNFCRENEEWHLLEKRASKTGVVDYVELHKRPPPGVDFVTLKTINVRSK
jgi:hypothetical protein